MKNENENALSTIVDRPEYKNRFNEVLGARAPQFISSMLAISQQDKMRDVDPRSIIAAAMTAATLDLPINSNLGFAHIVPYKGKAQFQMGYKGFIQLAMRTGQYRFMNACRVYEGELVRYNKLTGELVLDEEAKKSETVIGYASYFRTLNGFEHALFMTVEQCDAHGKRYSQSYKGGYSSVWKDDFDGMSIKTVIKLNLSKWGVLSIQMEKALFEDQAIHADLGAMVTYPDGQSDIERPRIGNGTAAPGPAATVPTAAPESKPANGRRKLKIVKGTDKTPEPTPAPGGAPPNAAEVFGRLSTGGYTVVELLQVAIKNQWLDPFVEELDKVPLGSIDEEKLGSFIAEWDTVSEQIDALRAAK